MARVLEFQLQHLLHAFSILQSQTFKGSACSVCHRFADSTRDEYASCLKNLLGSIIMTNTWHDNEIYGNLKGTKFFIVLSSDQVTYPDRSRVLCPGTDQA